MPTIGIGSAKTSFACAIACAVAALAGCQGFPIPSARFVEMSYARGPQPTLAQDPALEPAQEPGHGPAEVQELEPAESARQSLEGGKLPPTPVAESDENPLPAYPQKPEMEAEERRSAEEMSEPVASSPRALPRRQVASEPVPAPVPLPMNALPLDIPSERFHSPASECETAGVRAFDGAEAPYSGFCNTQACPPLFPVPNYRLAHLKLPDCRLRCYAGPLIFRNAPYDEQAMAEASLQPPFARFHPVPAAPVFEPRGEYEPPQLMMVPVKQPLLPRLSPHPVHPGPFAPHDQPNELAIPPVAGGDVAPEEPSPEVIGLSNTNRSLSDDAIRNAKPLKNWRAETIHRHRYR